MCIRDRDVRAQLQALDGRKGNLDEPLNQADLAQARMPFQGAVKGEAQRARFVRGEDRGLNEDQLIEKYRPANGKIAAQVVRRFEQQEGTKSDGFGVQLQRNEMPNERFNPEEPDPWMQEPGTRLQRSTAKEPARTPANIPQLPYGIDRDGPEQGARPDGDLKQLIDRANFVRRSPRYQKARQASYAVGGGIAGVAGLDALIGGEREKREEEAMR